MSVQGKNWCFTNYVLDTDYESWQGLGAVYVCWGVEKCPTTDKVHHQGYVEWVKNVSLGKTDRSFLKKLGNTIHWEKRKGTADQAIKYCEKEGDFHEFGVRPSKEQGKRTDLDTVKEMIKQGAPMAKIVDECSSYQGIRMAEKLKEYTEVKRNWKPEVYWYYGPTGCGKTKRAVEEAGEDYWMSGRDLRWWQGYDGHEHVVIDDFRGDFCKLHELLRILDRYPYTVEVKGGSRQLLARKIWITCPVKPEEVYKSTEDIGQLLRRITKVENLDPVEVIGQRLLKSVIRD